MASPSDVTNKKIADSIVKARDAKKRLDAGTVATTKAQADLTASLADIDAGYAELKSQMDEGYLALKTELGTATPTT